MTAQAAVVSVNPTDFSTHVQLKLSHVDHVRATESMATVRGRRFSTSQSRAPSPLSVDSEARPQSSASPEPFPHSPPVSSVSMSPPRRNVDRRRAYARAHGRSHRTSQALLNPAYGESGRTGGQQQQRRPRLVSPLAVFAAGRSSIGARDSPRRIPVLDAEGNTVEESSSGRLSVVNGQQVEVISSPRRGGGESSNIAMQRKSPSPTSSRRERREEVSPPPLARRTGRSTERRSSLAVYHSSAQASRGIDRSPSALDMGADHRGVDDTKVASLPSLNLPMLTEEDEGASTTDIPPAFPSPLDGRRPSVPSHVEWSDLDPLSANNHLRSARSSHRRVLFQPFEVAPSLSSGRKGRPESDGERTGDLEMEEENEVEERSPRWCRSPSPFSHRSDSISPSGVSSPRTPVVISRRSRVGEDAERRRIALMNRSLAAGALARVTEEVLSPRMQLISGEEASAGLSSTVPLMPYRGGSSDDTPERNETARKGRLARLRLRKKKEEEKSPTREQERKRRTRSTCHTRCEWLLPACGIHRRDRKRGRAG